MWFLHEKECSFKTNLFCCTEMRLMSISSNAIWVTGSVASRARSKLTRSKCEWTRIWTTYLENRWNNPLSLNPKELLFISEHRSLSCLTGCGRRCHWCQKQLIMNWIWAGQKGPTVWKWPQNHRKFQTHFFWEIQNI